jgi:adenosylcobinamide-phosphate synthase
MIFIYSLEETLWMVAAALAVDRIVGDPARLTHPVVLFGRWIGWIEKRIYASKPRGDAFVRGLLLCVSTVALAFASAWLLVAAAAAVHEWLGYAANTWLISTTIAWKGLRDAGVQVHAPLAAGSLDEARKYTGYIVGRDTFALDEAECSRAAVETVAENTVDAVVSPVLFALLGGAPFAFLYRAANTLDSMVGYRNARYEWFGKASARLDDALNFIPARICALLIALASACIGAKARDALRSVSAFAHLHPSPNSGIPEAAVAGALGIRLGGVNTYGGLPSHRAEMGFGERKPAKEDIMRAVALLEWSGALLTGGIVCAALFVTLWTGG